MVKKSTTHVQIRVRMGSSFAKKDRAKNLSKSNVSLKVTNVTRLIAVATGKMRKDAIYLEMI